MPEELAIALVVLVFAGWLIVKLFQGLAAVFNDAHEELSSSITKKAEQRYSRRKNNLTQHIRVVLPNELEQSPRPYFVNQRPVSTLWPHLS